MIPTLTLCSLDRFCRMVDVYNYIIRVVNILTFIYYYKKHKEIRDNLLQCVTTNTFNCTPKKFRTTLSVTSVALWFI